MDMAEVRIEAPAEAVRRGGSLPALRRWNAGLGGLHLVQGALMLVLATGFSVPWLAIGIYLVGAGIGPGGPPGFVYGIYGSIFVFFSAFALNMVFQYRRAGRWRDYLYGERVYMLLSLTAKSLLAWQVFAGTLQPA